MVLDKCDVRSAGPSRGENMNGRVHQQVSILIVNDRPQQVEALASMLEFPNVKILSAPSGEEALRVLLTQPVAVILLDVHMPGMSGFETAQIIRSRPTTEHIPIIFVTAIDASDGHVVEGYSLGAVDYIFLPTDPEIIRAKVSVFIDLHRLREEVQWQAEWMKREAERKASDLETRLRSLLNNLSVGVFSMTSLGEVKEANPALLQLLSVESVSEVGSSRFRKLFAPVEREVVAGGRGLTQKMIRKEEIQITRKDGTKKWLSVTKVCDWSDDKEGRIEGIIEDITARKEAEDALRELNETLERRVAAKTEELRRTWDRVLQSERLASLGTLAAGIAHEINNPLNSMLLATQYAQRKGDPRIYQDTLTAIEEQIHRCEKIVRGILQFARNESTEKTPHLLSATVRHAIGLASTYSRPDVSIRFHGEREEFKVLMNPLEIEQVIVNLIQNAVEAANEPLQVDVLLGQTEREAILEIQDNGPGMRPEVVSKIFDPFYTTKAGSGGTGLGLSIVHGIISDHGGSISCDSKVGRGTHFLMRLPLWNEDEDDRGEELVD